MSRHLSWRPSQLPPRMTTCFQGVATGLLEGAAGVFNEEDAQRRVEVNFWRTLALLPRHVRQTLRRYWKSDAVPERYVGPEMPPLPIVFVGTPEKGLIPPNVLGCTDGFEFTFWLPLASIAPNSVLQTLVAHELAHAFLRVHGQESESENLEERAVRAVTLAWGFREEDLDVWCNRNERRMSP